MKHNIDKLNNLPSRGKVSVMAALMARKTKSISWATTDWDCSRQAKQHWSKKKAKNAKAKHRKKFKRK